MNNTVNDLTESLVTVSLLPGSAGPKPQFRGLFDAIDKGEAGYILAQLATFPDPRQLLNTSLDHEGNTLLILGLTSVRDRDLGDLTARLLALGASASARNRDGETPLHAAMARKLPMDKKLKLAQLLVPHGGKLTVRSEDGITPLDQALGCRGEFAPTPGFLRGLAALGCDFTARGANSMLPLMHVIRCQPLGALPLVEAMLRAHPRAPHLAAQADAESRLSNGELFGTPLLAAVYFAADEQVTQLAEVLINESQQNTLAHAYAHYANVGRMRALGARDGGPLRTFEQVEVLLRSLQRARGRHGSVSQRDELHRDSRHLPLPPGRSSSTHRVPGALGIAAPSSRARRLVGAAPALQPSYAPPEPQAWTRHAAAVQGRYEASYEQQHAPRDAYRDFAPIDAFGAPAQTFERYAPRPPADLAFAHHMHAGFHAPHRDFAYSDMRGSYDYEGEYRDVAPAFDTPPRSRPASRGSSYWDDAPAQRSASSSRAHTPRAHTPYPPYDDAHGYAYAPAERSAAFRGAPQPDRRSRDVSELLDEPVVPLHRANSLGVRGVEGSDLWRACERGQAEVAREHLRIRPDLALQPAHINRRNPSNWTLGRSNSQAHPQARGPLPLGIAAAERSRLGALEVLLDVRREQLAGPDTRFRDQFMDMLDAIDAEGMTALMHAVSGGNDRGVSVLLAAGASEMRPVPLAKLGNFRPQRHHNQLLVLAIAANQPGVINQLLRRARERGEQVDTRAYLALAERFNHPPHSHVARAFSEGMQFVGGSQAHAGAVDFSQPQTRRAQAAVQRHESLRHSGSYAPAAQPQRMAPPTPGPKPAQLREPLPAPVTTEQIAPAPKPEAITRFKVTMSRALRSRVRSGDQLDDKTLLDLTKWLRDHNLIQYSDAHGYRVTQVVGRDSQRLYKEGIKNHPQLCRLSDELIAEICAFLAEQGRSGTQGSRAADATLTQDLGRQLRGF